MVKYTILKNLTDKVGRTYSQEDIKEKLLNGNEYLLGELYTEDAFPEKNVALVNASHSFTNFELNEDNDLIADLQILDTPGGEILKSLLSEGIKIKTSIRAAGMVDKDKKISDPEFFGLDVIISD